MGKKNVKTMEPIPKKQIKEWNDLVRRTRAAVCEQDGTTYRLIILAGELVTNYGDGRLQRWAEEAGLSYSQAKQYKFLASKGFDQAFINRWCKTETNKNGINFSVIREIASFCGSLKSPYAEDKLQWAVDHKATVSAIRGYMHEIEAPYNHMNEASKSIKMALKDKQEHEGFSDYMLTALERFVEENPGAEDAVLRTVITDEESFKELEIKAGVREDADANAAEYSRKMVAKLKRIRGQIKDTQNEITANIALGHEFSVELHDQVKYLRDVLNTILETEVPTFEHLSDKAEELVIDPSRVA